MSTGLKSEDLYISNIDVKYLKINTGKKGTININIGRGHIMVFKQQDLSLKN